MTAAEINELIKKYGQAIYGFCWYLCGNKNDAEELYQDTMLKLVELKHRVVIKSGTEDEYLGAKKFCLAVASRLFKHRIGKQTERPEMVPIEDCTDLSMEENAEKSFLEKEEKIKLRKAVSDLPYKKKIVTLMYYYGEMEIKEIAKMLHIPEGTVKSRLNSAKADIKQKMEGQGYEGY